MGFQGKLKKMMVKEEEETERRLDYRSRLGDLVVILNQQEEKGIRLMLEAAEDCLSLPVEN